MGALSQCETSSVLQIEMCSTQLICYIDIKTAPWFILQKKLYVYILHMSHANVKCNII